MTQIETAVENYCQKKIEVAIDNENYRPLYDTGGWLTGLPSQYKHLKDHCIGEYLCETDSEMMPFSVYRFNGTSFDTFQPIRQWRVIMLDEKQK